MAIDGRIEISKRKNNNALLAAHTSFDRSRNYPAYKKTYFEIFLLCWLLRFLSEHNPLRLVLFALWKLVVAPRTKNMINAGNIHPRQVELDCSWLERFNVESKPSGGSTVILKTIIFEILNCEGIFKNIENNQAELSIQSLRLWAMSCAYTWIIKFKWWHRSHESTVYAKVQRLFHDNIDTCASFSPVSPTKSKCRESRSACLSLSAASDDSTFGKWSSISLILSATKGMHACEWWFVRWYRVGESHFSCNFFKERIQFIYI